MSPKLTFHPATPGRWRDLESLFGSRGACGGCWCMTWRLTRSQFQKNKGEGNRHALRRIVRSGAEPGVLAYADGEPVGWCAVAPRSELSFLERSRVLAPVDEKPVWSITCLFVAKAWRRQGLSTRLIEAAVKLAHKHGAKIVEAYPQDVKGTLPAPFVWTGITQAFKRAGFKIAMRRSKLRPIVRRELSQGRSRN